MTRRLASIAPRSLAFTAILILAVGSGCSESSSVTEVAGRASGRSGPGDSGGTVTPAEEPLASWQGRLLDLAYGAVSAMPLQPHVKNRSRAQEQVVIACLELGQPARAERYVEGIANWRRGIGYADIALHLIGKGRPRSEVERYLELADGASELVFKDANPQKWRHDRIRAKLARAWSELGDPERSSRYGRGLEDSQAAELSSVVAKSMPAESFDAEMKRVDGVLATGSFEQARIVMTTCAGYYDRFFDDPARRAAARERVVKGYEKLPPQFRIDMLFRLARHAMDHGDRAEGLAVIEEARRRLRSAQWLPRHEVPLLARFAQESFAAGDVAQATEHLTAAVERFEAGRAGIADIDRADVLRTIAEAWARIGDADTAREYYGMAVEAGVENPNSRPRADDLAETCCSMARHGVEPVAALWQRLRGIREDLGKSPW